VAKLGISMPRPERTRLDEQVARAVRLGVVPPRQATDSLVLRAGLALLAELDDEGFRAAVARMEVLRPGGPAKR
jgi:hypothetical protein